MPIPPPKFSNWVVRGEFREENQKFSARLNFLPFPWSTTWGDNAGKKISKGYIKTVPLIPYLVKGKNFLKQHPRICLYFSLNLVRGKTKIRKIFKARYLRFTPYFSLHFIEGLVLWKLNIGPARHDCAMIWARRRRGEIPGQVYKNVFRTKSKKLTSGRRQNLRKSNTKQNSRRRC